MNPTLAGILTLAVASTLALSACRGEAGGFEGRMDPEVYVAVMGELADLRKFPIPVSGDADHEAQADFAREAILIAHGVTAPELLAFAQSAGSDPALMETLADQIAAITDSLAETRDSVSADTASTVADTIVETSDTPSVDSVRLSRSEAMAEQRRERAKLLGKPIEPPPK